MGIGSRLIHSTAIIDPKAEVPTSVAGGPFVVSDAGVKIGEGCSIGPYVHLTGDTTLGKRNIIHGGAIIGDAPQELNYQGEPTRLRIGADNIFREHVTLHRSNSLEEDTIIGSHNFFMADSHVGHNAVVGDHTILANGALVGGHAVIGDQVFLSSNCGIHQFVRIGTLAMMQGNSGVSQDVPPFTMVVFGMNMMCGLNTVGLRRAGFTSEQRSELKACYKRVFMEGGNIGQVVKQALEESPGEKAREMLEFIAASTRGVCSHATRKR